MRKGHIRVAGRTRDTRGPQGLRELVTGQQGSSRLAAQQSNLRLSRRQITAENGSTAGLFWRRKLTLSAMQEPQNADGFGSVKTCARRWPR